MRVSRVLGGSLLTVWLVFAATASAEKTAEGFVKDRQTVLMDLVRSKGTAGADKQISTVFDGMLDYDSLARESLSRYWDERTEEEQKSFQDVLKQLVQRAYRKNLDKTAGYEVSYEGESRADAATVVKTVARSKTDSREEPIAIEYVVRRVNGEWRVQDIVTEGSSLVVNYRRQFSRIIKKKGFDELMRRMKNKLEKG